MASRLVKIALATVAGGVIIGVAKRRKGGKKGKRSGSTGAATGTYPYPPPRTFKGVAFAEGVAVPVFPVAPSSSHPRRLDVSYKDTAGKTHNRSARVFGANRAEGKRYHAGIDLFANDGDVIVAPEAGKIVGVQNFLNTIDGSAPDAMAIEGNNGVTFILGEIDENAFGLKVGDTVVRGQPVAKVQKTTNDSHMLHFETYRVGLTKNQPWWKSGDVPSHLLDPTDYLLRAKAAAEALA